MSITLSPSRILAYQSCGFAMFLKYVMKLPEEKSANLAFGGAFHKAAERMLREIYVNPGVDDGALIELGAYAFSHAFKFDDEDLAGTGRLLVERFPQAWRETGVKVAPHNDGMSIRPAIEIKGEWKVDTDITVIGYADIIVQTPDEAYAVIDIKTPRSGCGDEFAAKSLQLTAYSEMFGTGVAGFWEAIKAPVPKTKTAKGPHYKNMKIHVVEENIVAGHRQSIIDAVDDWSNGRFTRAPRAAYNSPCGMCSFAADCSKICVPRADMKAMARDVLFTREIAKEDMEMDEAA